MTWPVLIGVKKFMNYCPIISYIHLSRRYQQPDRLFDPVAAKEPAGEFFFLFFSLHSGINSIYYSYMEAVFVVFKVGAAQPGALRAAPFHPGPGRQIKIRVIRLL